MQAHAYSNGDFHGTASIYPSLLVVSVGLLIEGTLRGGKFERKNYPMEKKIINCPL